MSRIEKLLKRLGECPSDFSWRELEKVLNYFGYEAASRGKTGGSRIRFINQKTKDVITFHKSHPEKIVKKYQIKQLLEKIEFYLGRGN